MDNDPVLMQEWFAVARASDVMPARPTAVRLLGRDLVLWRSNGSIHAWQDLCIHRGAKLSLGSVRDDCLVCPYHGWQYAAGGECVHIPAQPTQAPPVKAHANVYKVEERYGLIWVCVGEPLIPVPQIAELVDSMYRKIIAGPYAMHAQGPRILENFLDVGHLPIVHGGYLGDPAHARIEDYEVEMTEHGIIARDIPIWQPDPDGTSAAAKVFYTYEVHRPLLSSFLKQHNGQNFRMVYTATPVDEQHSIAWAVLAMNYADDVPDAELLEFQNRITAQDKPIVESQRPELLPLDLREELHLRSDKAAIAYRQWLRQLGLKYGTA
jgi:phenylpropionate dioxygenase-like ring-hydroxylating dioxygenase large terminal subunit